MLAKPQHKGTNNITIIKQKLIDMDSNYPFIIKAADYTYNAIT